MRTDETSPDDPGDWKRLSQLERVRMIADTELAPSDLKAKEDGSDKLRRYFAEPGHAEWGC